MRTGALRTIVVLLGLVTLIPAARVCAEPGILGVYMDDQGADCNIVYNFPGLVSVVVVLTHTDAATAVQFSAPKPNCWASATYLSDTDIFPVTIGNSQTGKAVGFGQCLSSPIWVTEINYFVGTPVESCCIYPVLPDPNVPSGEIEVVDCDDNLLFAEGTYGIVNPDGTCWCQGVVPVEETTWGGIKALYLE